VGPEFGPHARSIIASALDALGVEIRTSTGVANVSSDSLTTNTGEVIRTHTVVWAAGVRANEAARLVGPAADAHGRLLVDNELRVMGTNGIWAAGDVAHALVDGKRVTMMSCQHAIPLGKHAGHNAMSALAGARSKPYAQHRYITCLDLGAWGALITDGFDRDNVICSGADGKEFKRFINTSVIYPPLDRNAGSILRAAKPPGGGRLAAALTSLLLRSRLTGLGRWSVQRRSALTCSNARV